MNKGLYGKYNITKANGKPTDPDAQYFVLRLDTDKHARYAVNAYADSLMADYRTGQATEDDAKFAIQLRNWVADVMGNQATTRSREGKPTYICPEDCQFFRGEDGCASDRIDNMAVYEKEGDYPICPFYFKPLLQKAM